MNNRRIPPPRPEDNHGRSNVDHRFFLWCASHRIHWLPALINKNRDLKVSVMGRPSPLTPIDELQFEVSVNGIVFWEPEADETDPTVSEIFLSEMIKTRKGQNNDPSID